MFDRVCSIRRHNVFKPAPIEVFRVNTLEFLNLDEAVRYAKKYGFISVMVVIEGVATERHPVEGS
jgi:hypothetical protein